MRVRRWVATGLGCVVALGMQALFSALGGLAGLGSSGVIEYAILFVALGFGGYVTGTLAGRLPIFYGALAAVVYIFVTVTYTATREAIVARQQGLGVLPAIDFVQLTVQDVLAMLGASLGGWLADRS
jgi:hypothetical protein